LTRRNARRCTPRAGTSVNVEGPFFYLHEATQTSAAAKVPQGYQPGWAGALAYRGGGFRTAYLAT
jgi:hypothetical protein